MFDKNLNKHAGEFRGYMQKHDYEVSDEGLLFPKAGVTICAEGEYHHSSNGGPVTVDKNIMPAQCLTYLMNAGFKDGAKSTVWYLSLYGGDYTPLSTLTAATYPAAASEIVSNTEGYSGTTRPVWTPGVVDASGWLDNLAAKATFTIATATSVTLRGAALLSSNVKGGTTGTLASASKFAAPRVQYNGDTYTLGYRLRLYVA